MGLAVAGIVLAVIFLALIVYFTGFAVGHPHVKHDLLFIVLMLLSLAVTWFAWPSRRVTNIR